MKKHFLSLILTALLVGACQHEPIIPDTEYINQAAQSKIAEYQDSKLSGSHNVFSIYLRKDSTGKEDLVVSAHINYNHTLDAVKVNQNDWAILPQHFGEMVFKTDASSAVDQTVSFQIRSKTPQNEIINQEVFIPKHTPITATDLGNNNFRINWTPQYRKQKILLYLSYHRVYLRIFNLPYAIETDDDGEFIFKSSVFEQFKEPASPFLNSVASEFVTVSLLRANPKYKKIVKQPSTGTEYSIYAASGNNVQIEIQNK